MSGSLIFICIVHVSIAQEGLKDAKTTCKQFVRDLNIFNNWSFFVNRVKPDTEHHHIINVKGFTTMVLTRQAFEKYLQVIYINRTFKNFPLKIQRSSALRTTKWIAGVKITTDFYFLYQASEWAKVRNNIEPEESSYPSLKLPSFFTRVSGCLKSIVPCAVIRERYLLSSTRKKSPPQEMPTIQPYF